MESNQNNFSEGLLDLNEMSYTIKFPYWYGPGDAAAMSRMLNGIVSMLTISELAIKFPDISKEISSIFDKLKV